MWNELIVLTGDDYTVSCRKASGSENIEFNTDGSIRDEFDYRKPK